LAAAVANAPDELTTSVQAALPAPATTASAPRQTPSAAKPTARAGL